jgi:hypothetical protein
MWPFKSKKHTGSSFGFPTYEAQRAFEHAVRTVGEEKAIEGVLASCDFQLARDEIADLFRATTAEARANRQQASWKREFAEGWQIFSGNPNVDTARAWLLSAPEAKFIVLNYFVECSPGGKFYFFDSIKRRGGRP